MPGSLRSVSLNNGNFNVLPNVLNIQQQLPEQQTNANNKRIKFNSFTTFSNKRVLQMNPNELLTSSTSSNGTMNNTTDNYSISILQHNNNSSNNTNQGYKTCVSSTQTQYTTPVSDDNDTPQMLRAYHSSSLNAMQINNVASYFTSNFDENGYVFDGVKVEIEDIDNTSLSNITTQSLKRCKKQVLKHYYSLLCFIGWRPFYKEFFYRMPFYCSILNFIYPILIIVALFYSYIYDVWICQGKVNVVLDTQNPIMRTTKLKNLTTTRVNNMLLGVTSLGRQVPDDQEPMKEICGHIITTYIFPSVLHLASFILGFIYFRINENEQLYALMEKVFLSTMKMVSQDRVIRRLKVFIIIGAFWVVLAISTHILYRAVYGIELELIKHSWVLISLQAIALVISNSVYLAVVINYATQCEMIIFYVQEIRARLEEKSITLKEAIQQILEIRVAIGNLNSTVSKMTTLVALIFMEKFIIGVIILVMNQVNEPLAWVYRTIFPLCWFSILTFCLVQVARLNSKCSKFKQIAISARVYGYHNCTRDELDSFLLFISNASLRAKLFGVPIKPSYLVCFLIAITFTIIILIQTSIISSPVSFI